MAARLSPGILPDEINLNMNRNNPKVTPIASIAEIGLLSLFKLMPLLSNFPSGALCRNCDTLDTRHFYLVHHLCHGTNP